MSLFKGAFFRAPVSFHTKYILRVKCVILPSFALFSNNFVFSKKYEIFHVPLVSVDSKNIKISDFYCFTFFSFSVKDNISIYLPLHSAVI